MESNEASADKLLRWFTHLMFYMCAVMVIGGGLYLVKKYYDSEHEKNLRNGTTKIILMEDRAHCHGDVETTLENTASKHRFKICGKYGEAGETFTYNE